MPGKSHSLVSKTTEKKRGAEKKGKKGKKGKKRPPKIRTALGTRARSPSRSPSSLVSERFSPATSTNAVALAAAAATLKHHHPPQAHFHRCICVHLCTSACASVAVFFFFFWFPVSIGLVQPFCFVRGRSSFSCLGSRSGSVRSLDSIERPSCTNSTTTFAGCAVSSARQTPEDKVKRQEQKQKTAPWYNAHTLSLGIPPVVSINTGSLKRRLQSQKRPKRPKPTPAYEDGPSAAPTSLASRLSSTEQKVAPLSVPLSQTLSSALSPQLFQSFRETSPPHTTHHTHHPTLTPPPLSSSFAAHPKGPSPSKRPSFPLRRHQIETGARPVLQQISTRRSTSKLLESTRFPSGTPITVASFGFGFTIGRFASPVIIPVCGETLYSRTSGSLRCSITSGAVVSTARTCPRLP